MANAIQEGKANPQCLVTTLKNKLRVAGDSIRKEKVATFIYAGDRTVKVLILIDKVVSVAHLDTMGFDSRNSVTLGD